jgi:hypothetical protein
MKSNQASSPMVGKQGVVRGANGHAIVSIDDKSLIRESRLWLESVQRILDRGRS